MNTASDQWVPFKLFKEYCPANFAKKQFGFFPQQIRANATRATMPQFIWKMQSNKINKEVGVKIITYLERDNNRITRKEVDNYKQQGNNAKKSPGWLTEKQHLKVRMENPEITDAYSVFCKKETLWIVQPTIEDRDTCLCKVMQFSSLFPDRLFYYKAIDLTQISCEY